MVNPDFDSIRDTLLDTYDVMVKASGDIPKFEDYIDDPDEDESPREAAIQKVFLAQEMSPIFARKLDKSTV